MPPDRPAPTEGRYHRRGEPWPLYASLEPSTAWAEWRAATHGAIDPGAERRRLWEIRVDDLAVLDLRDPDVLDNLGVALADLTGARGAAQDLAARAHAAGAEGMIVPSAARPGHWNLVVFPAGLSRLPAPRSRAMHPRPPG
jgi:RES domain-containing protein